jgi:hypothetical protein
MKAKVRIMAAAGEKGEGRLRSHSKRFDDL